MVTDRYTDTDRRLLENKIIKKKQIETEIDMEFLCTLSFSCRCLFPAPDSEYSSSK